MKIAPSRWEYAMTYCFDIDGVLASVVDDLDYSKAEPLCEAIALVNLLHDQGGCIKLFTARGTETGVDWTEVTRKQMADWGVKYDELIFGKPVADYYIDDRSIGLHELMLSSVQTFWESCDPTLAHITIDKWLENEESLCSWWETHILDKCKDRFVGKTLIDYGTGKGLFGKLLYEQHGLGKYIGIDISERSLNAARETLAAFPQSEFFHAPVDFARLTADIFVSFACIQHFPFKLMLDRFLENLNQSRIPWLLLQIRAGKNTVFNPGNMRLGCMTNLAYLLSKLTNYKTDFVGPVPKRAAIQYLGLESR